MISLGYSIFVVEGLLPPCEADQLLTLVPVEPEPTTASPTPGGQPSCADCPSKRGRTSEVDDEDESFALDLATAMSASLVTTTVTSQEPEGTVAARPCGLREEEEKEEPDLELPTASQDGKDIGSFYPLHTQLLSPFVLLATKAGHGGLGTKLLFRDRECTRLRLVVGCLVPGQGVLRLGASFWDREG